MVIGVIGGVGSVVVMLLVKVGYIVVVVIGKIFEEVYLKSLGVFVIVDWVILLEKGKLM